VTRPRSLSLALLCAAAALTSPSSSAAQEPAAPQPPAAAPSPAAPPSAAPATPIPGAPPGQHPPVVRITPLTAADPEPTPDEAEALLCAQDVTEVAESGALKIYGFTDFGLDKWFISRNGVGLIRPTSATTFVFGNLNLYFDVTPMERVRTLIEVRLTLAPHGEEIQFGPPLGTSYQRTDTTTFDFGSPASQAQLRLSGLFIERAVTEYSFSELLKLRWGLYLNPFGIWNLDHGSPTLIGLTLPAFIAAQMIPTRLLGVHLYGSYISAGSELGYSLHVSNGRSPLDFDLSEDKAIGARVYYAHDAEATRMVLGASGYLGTYLDTEKVINLSAATQSASFANDDLYTVNTTVDFAEQVLGLDAALDIGQLRVRSEAVLRWVNYEADKSERISTPDGSVQYLPNRLEWSAYALAAYRTPFRLEPYVQLEMAKKSYTMPRWAGPSRATASNYSSIFLSVGLNVQVTAYILIKSQLVWAHAYEDDITNPGADVTTLFLRIVDSF
jgi:hypothetical protein